MKKKKIKKKNINIQWKTFGCNLPAIDVNCRQLVAVSCRQLPATAGNKKN